MPRIAPSNSLLQASETETLCTITLRDNGVLRYATSNLLLSKGEYQNYLLDVGELKQNTLPEIDRIPIKLSNVDGSLGIIVASQLRKLEFAQVLVEKFYSPIGNRAAYQLFHYYSGILTGAETITEKQGDGIDAQFSKYVSFDVIPKRTASGISMADRNLSPSCAWNFKDPRTCGYIGPLQTCNKQQKSNNGCIRRLRIATNGGFTYPDAVSESAPSGNGGGIGGGNCFTGDTLISSSKGEMRINELTAEDLIVTFDENRRTKLERIKEFFPHVADGYYIFTFSDGSRVSVTGEHRFLTTRGWRRADHFVFGKTMVYRRDFETARVESARYVSGATEVFNFHVPENQTYFANGFAVHNAKTPELD